MSASPRSFNITDPRGNVSRFTYDGARRALTATDPLGTVTTTSYDGDGHPLSVTRSGGALSVTTSRSYTNTGAVKTATDANHNTTRFSYDLKDRLASIADPLGRTTNYSYDAFDQLATTANPAIQAAPLEIRGYGLDGELTGVTDANGNRTAFSYDGLDRLSQTTHAAGTSLASSESFVFDANDNLTSHTTRAGATIAYGYDGLNRRCSKTIAAVPVACGATTAAAPTVWYRHDLAGRLVAVNDNSPAIPAIAGPPALYAVATRYDAANRPIALAWNPAPPQAPPAPASVSFGHAYDSTNRRVGQTTSDTSWWYRPPPGLTVTPYAADALNRYSSVGSVSPSYDGNGNLTFDGTYSYGYDAENRLISASWGDIVNASFAYDGRGHRKSITLNGVTTLLVGDGTGPDSLEYSGATGAATAWNPRGPTANSILSRANLTAGTRTTPIADIQGSTIATLDSGTGALHTQNYPPYGGPSPGGFAFGYTGQRYDANTPLYDYHARAYHPTLGRFLQTDPIGIAGGNNLYAYVGNDPLNAVDPWGLYPVVLVTWLSGAQYVPMTNVKNSAQAASYGQPIGTSVPIAVPPTMDPQAPVNFWRSTMLNGPIPFAYYWRPGGPNDYKLQNPMYDAFGNFEYGATGAAVGYSNGTLTGMGDLLHRGTNNPINTQDILSGANAINSGGTLSMIDSSQIGNIGTNTNSNGDNASTINSGQVGSEGKK